MTTSTDFIIGGMTSDMAQCGVSFTGSSATGYLMKNTDIETCYSWTQTVETALAAVPISSITWDSQSVPFNNPSSESFSSGNTAANIPSVNLYSQPATCCFTLVAPDTSALVNPKYFIEDVS